MQPPTNSVRHSVDPAAMPTMTAVDKCPDELDDELGALDGEVTVVLK